jgi:hypothetical protein
MDSTNPMVISEKNGVDNDLTTVQHMQTTSKDEEQSTKLSQSVSVTL